MSLLFPYIHLSKSSLKPFKGHDSFQIDLVRFYTTYTAVNKLNRLAIDEAEKRKQNDGHT